MLSYCDACCSLKIVEYPVNDRGVIEVFERRVRVEREVYASGDLQILLGHELKRPVDPVDTAVTT